MCDYSAEGGRYHRKNQRGFRRLGGVHLPFSALLDWRGEAHEWRMRGSGPRVRGTRRRGSVDPCTDLRFDVRRARASSTQPKREECRRHHKSRGPSPRRLPTESRLVSALGLRQKLSDAAALDASASMLLFSTLRLHTTLRPRATRVMLSLLHGGASSGLLWREQLQRELWSVVRSPTLS
jgi:hypothetical protein